jgi:predicted O-methyltransferase YrrM
MTALAEWITNAQQHYPAPLDATAHGFGTDIQHDLPALWSLTIAHRPRIIVELGTRQAISTRTLAHAAETVLAMLLTCDPNLQREYLDGVPCFAYPGRGEVLYESRKLPQVDLLFVDTDPHDFEQTTLWLDTWVAHNMAPGGIACFHDVNARDIDGTPRPDIQVAEACRAWVTKRGGLWEYVELRHDGAGGLGVLRRTT